MDPETLPADVEVTHINLNDGTCAGLLCKPKKAMSIQYHPEASPGPPRRGRLLRAVHRDAEGGARHAPRGGRLGPGGSGDGVRFQYHPEASLRPHDSDVCFEQFIELMKADRGMPLAATA